MDSRGVPPRASAAAAEPVNAELGTESAPIHDCWNLIGVEGNRTCRELLKFTHCRNCPVYSAAAIQLLDRPLPADYRRQCAEHYMQQKKIAPATRLSVVIFRLANEWLALPTAVFQEVASPCEIPRPVALAHPADAISQDERRPMHSLPHRRGGLVLGLVNVRGELLICASAAQLLGLEQSEVSGPKSKVTAHPPGSNFRHETSDFRLSERLLVTSWNGLRLAFLVDEVHGIQRFPQDELKAPLAWPTQAAPEASPRREPPSDDRLDPPLRRGEGPPAQSSEFRVSGSGLELGTRNAERGTLLTFTQGVFTWRDHTVGLLDSDSFFNTLNRNLAL